MPPSEGQRGPAWTPLAGTPGQAAVLSRVRALPAGLQRPLQGAPAGPRPGAMTGAQVLKLLSLQTRFPVVAGGGGRRLPLRVLGQPHHSLAACLSSSGHGPRVPLCPGEAAARREHRSSDTRARPGMCPTRVCPLLSPPRWRAGHWPEGLCLCLAGRLHRRQVCARRRVWVHLQRSPRRPGAPRAWAGVPEMQTALHTRGSAAAGDGGRAPPVTWKLPRSAGWGSAGRADLRGRRAGGRTPAMGSGRRGCPAGTGSRLPFPHPPIAGRGQTSSPRSFWKESGGPYPHVPKTPGGLPFRAWLSLEMRCALPPMFSPGLSFWVRMFRARERCVPSPLGS